MNKQPEYFAVVVTAGDQKIIRVFCTFAAARAFGEGAMAVMPSAEYIWRMATADEVRKATE